MRFPATLALATLLAAGCVGMGGEGPPGGDGCRYAWEYGGARVTDEYAAPALDNATRLLDGTTLREIHNVTAPDLVRKADYPHEEADSWRWQFPSSYRVPGYHAMMRAYVDPGNGTLLRVRVDHDWMSDRSVSGLTWGNVSLEKLKAEPRYREDLAVNLTPEVQRVRAALAPALGEPAGSREEMMWEAHRNACV